MEQPELEREVRALAARVAALESRVGLEPVGSGPELPHNLPADVSSPHADLKETAGALGRCLLGMAGAYLLRALTESGSLPAGAGVIVGILYAVAWLILAARTPAERQIDAALHSLTAVLVMAPLLWEATFRLHAVSTWTAGTIVLCFTLFGLAVSWRKNLLIVATIATLAGIGTASAMLVASHDVVPFLFVLLGIAAAVEASSCLDHWLNERWLAALAADLGVLLATWLVFNKRGLPEIYAPISQGALLAAQASLLAIYLASTIIRTLLRHVNFTSFEIAQCAAAFLIGTGGGLHLSPAMAAILLACGVACYVVSFAVIERSGHGRNFHTYSTFGLVLALVGSRILLTDLVSAAVWLVLAIACMWTGRPVLQVHGCVYLVLAVAGSGALWDAAAFLLGSASFPGHHGVALCAGLLTAVACYTRARRSTVLRLTLAGLMVWLLAAVAAGVLAAAYHAAFAGHVYCATIRTGVVACTAFLLAWTGARLRLVELSNLIYPAMLVGAYRLFMIDLREDHKTALVVSLLLYGTALIAIPKLARR